jgi:hypothetical protein
MTNFTMQSQRENAGIAKKFVSSTSNISKSIFLPESTHRSNPPLKVPTQHNGPLKSPLLPHDIRCTTYAIIPASDLAPPLHIIGSSFAL